MVVLVVIASLCKAASALDCEPQKSELAELNQAIIIRDREDARHYQLVKDNGTERVRNYLEGQILQQLRTDSFPQPTNIELRIRCVQSAVPQYEIGRKDGSTNMPVAFLLSGDKPTVAVGFEIYRGGAGAPDIRPYFAVFQKRDHEWTLSGEVGSSFTQRTFFVHPIKAGRPGESWFLLWGKRIGDSGARLRVAIAAYNGTSLREIWSVDGLTGTQVTGIFGDHIILEGEVTNQKGRAEDFRERFDVVPEGLKLVKREIMKSY